MNNKYNSALGAYEKILKMDFHNASIGIGTGSTTDIFTKNFLYFIYIYKFMKIIRIDDKNGNLLNNLNKKHNGTLLFYNPQFHHCQVMKPQWELAKE